MVLTTTIYRSGNLSNNEVKNNLIFSIIQNFEYMSFINVSYCIIRTPTVNVLYLVFSRYVNASICTNVFLLLLRFCYCLAIHELIWMGYNWILKELWTLNLANCKVWVSGNLLKFWNSYGMQRYKSYMLFNRKI